MQVDVKDMLSCSGTPGHLHCGCGVELTEEGEGKLGKLGKLRLLLLLLGVELLGLLLLGLLLLGLLLLGLLLLGLLLELLGLLLELLELLELPELLELLELLLLELLGQMQSHSLGRAMFHRPLVLARTQSRQRRCVATDRNRPPLVVQFLGHAPRPGLCVPANLVGHHNVQRRVRAAFIPDRQSSRSVWA